MRPFHVLWAVNVFKVTFVWSLKRNTKQIVSFCYLIFLIFVIVLLVSVFSQLYFLRYIKMYVLKMSVCLFVYGCFDDDSFVRGSIERVA